MARFTARIFRTPSDPSTPSGRAPAVLELTIDVEGYTREEARRALVARVRGMWTRDPFTIADDVYSGGFDVTRLPPPALPTGGRFILLQDSGAPLLQDSGDPILVEVAA